MTDREHRIDTGSPEERVRAEYPDVIAFNDEGLWSIRRPIRWDRFVELAPLDDDDPEFPTEAEAWADAASRLETK